MDRNSPYERIDYWRETMKYFVFADPHGNYDALLSALNENGYDKTNPNHQLVGLGDYFGRAAQSNSDCVNIWRYLKSGKHVNRPICLRGNHESILIEAIHRRGLTETDILNGEHNTFASFAGVYPSQIEYDYQRQFEVCKTMYNCGFVDWLETLPWYFETEHYIFTHGFVPLQWFGKKWGLDKLGDWEWNSASWAIVPDYIRTLDNTHIKVDKTVVFGHWRAKELNEKFLGKWEPEDGNIYVDEERKLIGLDCTTVLSHKVGCVVLED